MFTYLYISQQVVSDEAKNIFVGLSATQWKDARKAILACILGTDMVHHVEQVSKAQVPHITQHYNLSRPIGLCLQWPCVLWWCRLCWYTIPAILQMMVPVGRIQPVRLGNSLLLYLHGQVVCVSIHMDIYIQVFFEVNGESIMKYYSGERDTMECLADNNNRLLVMELIIHCADISNPYKPFDICAKWADLVVEEFFSQVPHWSVLCGCIYLLMMYHM